MICIKGAWHQEMDDVVSSVYSRFHLDDKIRHPVTGRKYRIEKFYDHYVLTEDGFGRTECFTYPDMQKMKLVVR